MNVMAEGDDVEMVRSLMHGVVDFGWSDGEWKPKQRYLCAKKPFIYLTPQWATSPGRRGRRRRNANWFEDGLDRMSENERSSERMQHFVVSERAVQWSPPSSGIIVARLVVSITQNSMRTDFTRANVSNIERRSEHARQPV